jgi:predicted metal-dependent phosphoesterase TrpH
LSDFHVHTTWSDGRLSIREVVDLYGQTERFDVIAITDHILMKRDFLARVGRFASFGLKRYSVTEERWREYRDEIEKEAERARQLYDLLVIPGAEITQNHLRSRKNSHIVALNLREYVSADQTAEQILREIRRQGALSIACHPHHRTTRRIEISTCYLWDKRKRLVNLVDVWEAANRDDLFSVTSLKHYPYVANSDFHKPKHLYSWKTLIRAEKNWSSIAKALRENVDVALTLYRNGSWIPAKTNGDHLAAGAP